jgi:hypothetical protein
MGMSQLIELGGMRFGKLTVMARVPSPRKSESPRKRAFWKCQCECGKETVVESTSLRTSTRSCGCGRSVSHFIHGMGNKDRITRRRNQAYSMFVNAKQRAKKKGIPFEIKLSDLTIPAVCPVLGIPLRRAKGGCDDNSPTLDEIRYGRGYVLGNVAVISYRANRLKSDAGTEEIRAVLAYMESYAA